jgi:hypothetical protein
MQPVQLPRPEFALAKVGRWALYFSHGKLYAYRMPFQTMRSGAPFEHEAKYLEWPSSSDDVPEVTRQIFNNAEAEWRRGIT